MKKLQEKCECGTPLKKNYYGELADLCPRCREKLRLRVAKMNRENIMERTRALVCISNAQPYIGKQAQLLGFLDVFFPETPMNVKVRIAQQVHPNGRV